MGWWFNGLINDVMNHHFRCNCNMLMAPRLIGVDLNRFNCPNNSDGHDRDIYLSWCIDPFCSHIIDSRIDKIKCEEGKYICSKCGSCCKNHKQVTTNQVKNDPIPF